MKHSFIPTCLISFMTLAGVWLLLTLPGVVPLPSVQAAATAHSTQVAPVMAPHFYTYTITGPYTPDDQTLLLLHFDGDYAGAQGEAGVASGTTFTTSGQYADGVVMDATDTLTYPTANNLNLERGAIEFWIQPNWHGNDGQAYTFFEAGSGEWYNRLRIMKDGANNLRFMVWNNNQETGVGYNIDHWLAGEWHHVAVGWEESEIVLFTDGERRDSSGTAQLPDTLPTTISVGSNTEQTEQANATLDELRISDIPRVGEDWPPDNPTNYLVSGVVRDGTTGWPLYASITIAGLGYTRTTIWNDPVTGYYSLTLPESTDYTFVATAWITGYQTTTQAVAELTGDRVQDLALTVDLAACNAPGYTFTDTSYFEDFEAGSGGYLTRTFNMNSWEWGEPAATPGPGSAHSGYNVWATNLAGNYSDWENGVLTSPEIDLGAYAGEAITVTWWQWLYSEPNYDPARVEVSNDGGNNWTTVYGPFMGEISSVWTPITVALDSSYAVSNFQVRFHLNADESFQFPGWYIDDIQIQTESDLSYNVYAESFEGDPGGYSISLTGHTSWEPGEPTSGPGYAYSGSNVWATNLYGDYFENEDGYVVSPLIDLSSYSGERPVLRWQQWLETEAGLDLASLEVSNNDGQGWARVYGGVSGNVDTDDWRERQVVLNTWDATSDFRLRFRLSSDAVTQYAGWYLDDVMVSVCRPEPGGLVVGNVYDNFTHLPVAEALVSSEGGQIFTATATLDPAVPDSFYALFSPAGAHEFQAEGDPALYAAPDYRTLNVLANNTIRQDFLLPRRTHRVEGYVSDNTTDWPLYARLDIYSATTPITTVWTNPFNGYYELDLPADLMYTFTTTTWVAGYLSLARTLDPLLNDEFESFYLNADLTACTAPGYFDDGGCAARSGGFLIGQTYQAVTSAPLPGVIVSNSQDQTSTSALTIDPNVDDAFYVLFAPAGQHTFTATHPLYGLSGIQSSYIYPDDTNWQDFYLSGQQVISGFITDATAGWSLYASLHISGTGYNDTIWTDPVTGFYSLTLEGGLSYTLEVDAWTEGYQPSTRSVVPLAGGRNENFELNAELATCTAPGYTPDGGCHAQSGGLVVGNTYDARDGGAYTGVVVANDSGYSTTTQTTPDWNVDDAFYVLFSPAGAHTFTATYTAGYMMMDIQTPTVILSSTVRQDFDLILDTKVVSGVVTDATSGWPLYARLQINSPSGNQTIWTNPTTGAYSVTLARNVNHIFNVSAWVNGYVPRTYTSGVLTSDQIIPLTVTADLTTCIAPGYQSNFYFEDFELSNGGYTVVPATKTSWQWGLPYNGYGAGLAHSGSNVWATELNNFYDFNEDGYLVSPNIDLSLYAGQPITLTWWHWLQAANANDQASVEVSNNGGSSWTRVFGEWSTYEYSWHQQSVALNSAYAVNNFRLRFRFHTDSINVAPGWYVDDIAIYGPGLTSCAPQTGGLVVGNVYDANTGAALANTPVTNDAKEFFLTRSTSDPAVNDAFYVLFSPAGSHPVTSTRGNYLTTVATPTIAMGIAVLQNFNLPAAQAVRAPATLNVTQELGTSSSAPLLITNTGTAPLSFNLAEYVNGLPGASDIWGYSWYTSTAQWIDATGSMTLNLSGDDEANLDLPFYFPLYYSSANRLRVGNNGAALFPRPEDDIAPLNAALSSIASDYFLAPFWDDLGSNTTGRMYWLTGGIAPNRYVVVEWYNRPHAAVGGSATFEMILFENGNILFQYQDVDFGNVAYNNGASATVGIRGSNASQVLQYSYNSAALSNGMAICFRRANQPPCLPTQGAWLSTTPTSATVGISGTQPIGAVLDAALVEATGTYTAWLRFDHNTPYVVDDVLVRMNVLSRSLQLEPLTTTQYADPGTVATHTLRVRNVGTISKTFELTTTSNSWTVQLPSTITLPPETSSDLNVGVAVPADAPLYITNVVTITAAALDGTSRSIPVPLTTIRAVHSATLELPTLAQFDWPGNLVTYTLHLTNTGNVTDAFVLIPAGNVWTTNISPASLMLPPNTAAPVSVTVEIPLSAITGPTDVVSITAAYLAGAMPLELDVSVLRTTAIYYQPQIEPAMQTKENPTGDVWLITYTLNLTNSGNQIDTFHLATLSPWAVSAPTVLGPFSPYSGTSFIVTVTVPMTAPHGTNNTTILTATSQSDNTKSAASTLIGVARTDWVVTDTLLLPAGNYSFNNLTIMPGGTLRLQSDPTSGSGVTITAQNITINPGGAITADGLGYPGQQGPGAGISTGWTNGPGGGAYGGWGGSGNGTSGGSPYGSVYQPHQSGSGGGSGNGLAGGAGGGAIRLIVNDMLAVSGTLSTNGGAGTSNTFDASGGGAGGSIWIETGMLLGNGTIRANGGSGGATGSYARAGGGSGGRIATHYQSSTFNGIYQSIGGSSSTQYGGPGTVYLKGVAEQGALRIDNAGVNSLSAALLSDTYEFDQISQTHFGHLRILSTTSILTISNGTLRGDGSATLSSEGWIVAPASFTISGTLLAIQGELSGPQIITTTGSGGLELYAHTPWHTGVYTFTQLTVGTNTKLNLVSYNDGDSDYNDDYGLELRVENLTIANGGTVSADGLGYATAAGPGQGTSGSGAYSQAGGGGHGGWGGVGSGNNAGGVPYGDVDQPVQLGSGGGNSGGTAGGAGGGAIHLVVSETLALSGTVSANGMPGVTSTFNGSGGGAGGSLWIEAGTLSGNGTIRVNGSNGGNSAYYGSGGGGSGGRIAVYYQTSVFMGSLQARGGSSSSQYGGPGTIYSKRPAGLGVLNVDNAGANGRSAALLPGTYQFDEVRLTNYGHLNVLGNLALTANTLQGHTNSRLTVTGTLTATEVSAFENVGVIAQGPLVVSETLRVYTTTVDVPGQLIGASDLLIDRRGRVVLYAQSYPSGTTTLDTLEVTSGTLTLVSYDNGNTTYTDDASFTLVARTISVGMNSLIEANAQGYGLQRGPGSHTSGSSHGGYGGGAAPTYGSVYTPTLLGSSGDNGRGGGAVHFVITEALTLNGKIQTNGLADGSGGSIWIDTPVLSGSVGSRLQANGGSAAGGGGRIALYATNFSGYAGSIEAGFGGGECPFTPVTQCDGSIYLNSVDPYASTIEALPTSVVANGVGASLITVTLKNVTGYPVADQPVQLLILPAAGTSIGGQPATGDYLTIGTSNLSGTVTTTLTATTAGLRGVGARAANGATIYQTALVTFTNGTVSPARSRIEIVGSANATADGIDTIDVCITARDAFSNPVAGALVVLTSTAAINLNQPASPTDLTGQTLGSVTSTVSGPATVGAIVDGVLISNTITATFIGADLAVTKTGPTEATPGFTATYDLNVRNQGQLAATNVVLTDTLSPYLSFITQTGPYSFTQNGNQLIWQIGVLTPNQQSAFQVQALVITSTPIYTPVVNLATASTATTEHNLANNSAQTTASTIPPTPRLVVSPAAPTLLVGRGATTTLTVTIRNAGTAPLTNVVVNPPPHINWVTVANGVVGDLQPGQLITVVVQADATGLPPAGYYRDFVRVTSDNGGQRPIALTVLVSEASRDVVVTVVNNGDQLVPFADATIDRSILVVTEGVNGTEHAYQRTATNSSGVFTLTHQEVGSFDYTLTAPGHQTASGTVAIVEGLGPQPVTLTMTAAPSLIFTPGAPQLNITPGEIAQLEVRAQNAGVLTLTNIVLTSTGNIPWMYLGQAGNTAALGPAQSFTLTLNAAPPEDVAPAIYNDSVSVGADGGFSTSLAYSVRVTHSEVRTLQVTVIDSEDHPVKQADLQLMAQQSTLVISGTTTTLQRETYLGLTDDNGQYVFPDLPLGDYHYEVGVKGYRAGAGTLKVEPGVGVQTEIIRIPPPALSIEWTVEPTPFEDVYTATLSLVFDPNIVRPGLGCAPLESCFSRTNNILEVHNFYPVTITNAVIDITFDCEVLYNPILGDIPPNATVPVTLTFGAGCCQGDVPCSEPAKRHGGQVHLTGEYNHLMRASLYDVGAVQPPSLMPPGTFYTVPLHLVNEGFPADGNLLGDPLPIEDIHLSQPPVLTFITVSPTHISHLEVGQEADFELQVEVPQWLPQGVYADAIVITATNGISSVLEIIAEMSNEGLTIETQFVTPLRHGEQPPEGGGGGTGGGGQPLTPPWWQPPEYPEENEPIEMTFDFTRVCCRDCPHEPIYTWGRVGGTLYVQAYGSGGWHYTPHFNGGLVYLEIVQRISLEREAFTAKMMLTHAGGLPVEDLNVDILVTDNDGLSWIIDQDQKVGGFLITPTIPTTLTNMVSGTQQVAMWTLIPSGMNITEPQGRQFYMQAFLTYKVNGTEYAYETQREPITVMPEPFVLIDYFLPRYVWENEPFKLWVMATNIGWGSTKNFKIESAQPRITRNDSGLPIDFKIISDLIVYFGTLLPGQTETRFWSMVVNHDGTFLDFKATCTHANYLGLQLSDQIWCNPEGNFLENPPPNWAKEDQCLSSNTQGYSEDPVSTLSGNFTYNTTDVSIPTWGDPLMLERTYNALDVGNGPFGPGWTHNYNSYLTYRSFMALSGGLPVTTPLVTMQMKAPRGSLLQFKLNPNDSFTAMPGVKGELTRYLGTYTVTLPDQSKFIYNAEQWMTKQIDPNGNALTLAYDGLERLTSVTDLVGRSLSFTYNLSDHITSMTDPLGRITQYGYDSAGYLTTITDTRGLVTRMSYISNHEMRRLQTITDPNGHIVVTNNYDTRGRVVRQFDGVGNLTTFAYGDKVTTMTGPRGDVTLDYYDDQDRLIKRMDALGYSELYEYDGNNNRTAVTDKNGRRSQFVWDGPGCNMTAVVDPAGNTTQFTYDGHNRPTSQIDALGRATTFTYGPYLDPITLIDPLNRVTTRTYGSHGEQLSETDPATRTTSYAYDAYGNQTAITNALGYAQVTHYDLGGRPTQLIDPLQRTTTLIYDLADHLLQATGPTGQSVAYAYDGVGNQTIITDALGRVTRFEYDVLNRPVTVTANYVDGIFDPVRPDEDVTTLKRFDAAGNAVIEIDALGRITRNGYDLLNRIITTTNPLGYTQVYTYDGVGNRLAETDAAGHTTLYNHDLLNRQSVVTDTQGNVTRYAYDQVGNLVTTTNALSRTIYIQYDRLKRPVTVTLNYVDGVFDPTRPDEDVLTVQVYDLAGNIVQRYDSLGRVTHYTYDHVNQLLTTTDPLSNTTGKTYDAAGNLLTTTDPNGRLTRYAYDDLNRMTLVTDALSGTLRYGYDTAGNVISTTDELSRTTVAHYDALYRPITTTFNYVDGVFAAARPAEDVSTVTRYDAVGNVIAEIDSLGHVTRYAYNARNLLITATNALSGTTRITYDRVGNRLTETDAAGHLITYGYDSLYHVVAITDHLGYATTFGYDALGNRTRVTDALSRTKLIEYDRLNHPLTITFNYVAGVFDPVEPDRDVTTVTRYDGAGNVVAEIDPLGYVTRHAYDALNRLITSTNALSGTIVRGYDAVGNQIVVTNANGFAAYFVYDALDRNVVITNALGEVTSFAYNAVGNQISLTDALSRTTILAYDGLDRPITVTNPLTGTTVYAWDAASNQVAVTDAEGRVTRSGYDALNRLIVITDTLNQVSRFGYDVVGNQTVMTDANGHATHYGYDALDRQVVITDTLGQTSHFAYDAVGNSVMTVDAEGNTTTFGYDALNRNTIVTDALGSVAYHVYDARGNELQLIDPEGHLTHTAYDALNRIITVTNALSGTTAFTYDAIGNPLTQTDAEGRTTRYAYDALNRPITITDPLTGTTLYRYDAVGNLIATIDAEGRELSIEYDAVDRQTRITDPLTGTTTFGYDAVGNLLHATDAEGQATHYAYDDLNRPRVITDALSQTTQYTYDAVGNPLTTINARGQTTTFAYDAVDRLVQTTDPLSGTTAFAYDRVGNQTVITDATGRATQLAYDGVYRLIVQSDVLGNTTRYAYDRIGNAILITDATGIATRNEYNALSRLTAVIENYRPGLSTTVDTNVRTEYGYDRIGNSTVVTDANQHATHYAYDARDRQTHIVDPLNHAYQFNYDRVDNLIARRDANGQTITFTYDALNRPIVLHYPEQLVSLAYNRVGSRVTLTDSLGTTHYTYDALQRLTATQDSNNQLVMHAYDATSNRSGLGYPNSQVVSYTYDLADQLSGVTDWDGNAAAYQYDAAGRPLTVTLPNGIQTRYTYDAAGRLIQIEQRSGAHVLARYEYELDALGYRVAVTETVNPPQPPRAGFSATPLSGLAPLTVTFVNTSTGDIVSHLWNFGDGITSTLANPVHRYDVAGVYTVTLTANGVFESDVITRPAYISVTSSTPNPPHAGFYAVPRAGAAPLNVTFVNTSTGDIVSQRWTFGDGYTSTAPAPVHRYELAGRYTVTLAVNGVLENNVITRPAYIRVFTVAGPLFSDDAESGDSQWITEGSWAISTEAAHSGSFAFSDSPGDNYPHGSNAALTLADPITLPTDAPARLEFWDPIDLGAGDHALVEISTDNGQSWTPLIDRTSVSNVSWTRHTADLAAYAGQSILLRFRLDARQDTAVGDGWHIDDVLVTTAPESIYALPFDDPAETLTNWFAEGSWGLSTDQPYTGTASFADSPIGNYAARSSAALELNGQLNLAGVLAPQLTYFERYDLAAGDAASVEVSINNGQTWTSLFTQTTGTQANWTQRTIDLRNYSGQLIRLRFRLESANDLQVADGWRIDAISIASAAPASYRVYLPLIQRSAATTANAATTTAAATTAAAAPVPTAPRPFPPFDPATLLLAPVALAAVIGRKSRRWAGLVGVLALILVAFAMTSGFAVATPLASPTRSSAIARSETPTNAQPQGPYTRVTRYTYDGLHRLIGASDSTGRVYTYTYDAVGNRLSANEPGFTAVYTYDAANQLTAVNGVTYTWDANGNLLSDGQRTFTYDSGNRLTHIITGGLTIENRYSGDGLRRAQIINGTPIRYVLDEAAELPQVLAEETAQADLQYLYGLDQIAVHTSSGWVYQLSDGLGSVRQQASSLGYLTGEKQYEPFGQTEAQSGSTLGSFGYAGEQLDAASGLIFLRARYYDPATGRFLTRDPYPAQAAAPGTLHRYAYAANDPVNQVDPSGLYTRVYRKSGYSSGVVYRTSGSSDGVVYRASGSSDTRLYRSSRGSGLRGSMYSRAYGQRDAMYDQAYGLMDSMLPTISVGGRSYTPPRPGQPYNQSRVNEDRANAVDQMNAEAREGSKGHEGPSSGDSFISCTLKNFLRDPNRYIEAVGNGMVQVFQETIVKPVMQNVERFKAALKTLKDPEASWKEKAQALGEMGLVVVDFATLGAVTQIRDGLKEHDWLKVASGVLQAVSFIGGFTGKLLFSSASFMAKAGKAASLAGKVLSRGASLLTKIAKVAGIVGNFTDLALSGRDIRQGIESGDALQVIMGGVGVVFNVSQLMGDLGDVHARESVADDMVDASKRNARDAEEEVVEDLSKRKLGQEADGFPQKKAKGVEQEAPHNPELGMCQFGKNSFDGDTLVTTKDGEKPISELTIGDVVLAYDETLGITGTYTVTDILVNYDTLLTYLTIDGEPVETTPEHPFYTAEQGWVDAGALWIGAHIQKADSSYGTVEAVGSAYGLKPMYNLTVDTAHTFYVGDGQWLVHNANKKNCSPYRGGPHNETTKPPNDKLESHHMPAKASSPIPEGKGPAIQMEPSEHRLTSSHGTRGASATAYRKQIKDLIDQGRWREAMALEIRDVRRATGTKYNQAMREMLEYAKKLRQTVDKNGKIIYEVVKDVNDTAGFFPFRK
ncbi:tRNA(Glu)-specific nuclease WapA [Thermoflexales bacterium]|nr:tRNA(Glu)-specific nuclease WapA [Thermoflexales bacterium]